ncbi:ATP-binding cassette domain-containing protein [Apibacter muscae]|uniref:ATP-binding cassette domain-containing protein n=1 Tax=Apibacter muscae TaxID=2509004 RepID=A0A563DHV8_9FLAO|nr:ATP-binding cassette domain-containing protein [Apibacter muscae]TWP29785.1 ATP-binding cassette domain-containing protein [Apibacter muscae]TWP30933.1 ATP-binding cassette domain-containing protein [Apibacter muscae]
MITASNITKSFDGVQVLKGISVTFEKGKTNLIIGQSGSGKTVFLKCMLGLFEPTTGEILYERTNASKLTTSDRQKLRSEIGTVFQGSALFDSMTVEQNVKFPLEMFANMTEKQMRDRVDEVLERVNLTNARKKYPSEISGGMQKRVAIARAIVNNPKYLFCDEPNSGLDPQTSQLIDKLIHEITQEYNTTTIINTHDMNSVLEIGEKIVYLKNGYKEWEGDKNSIIVAENKPLQDFVFSSPIFKKAREAMLYEINNFKNKN